MTNRRVFKGWLLLGVVLAWSVQADDGRRFGNSRSRDYGYQQPRYQPVLPTRPFFVQPYPRNGGQREGRHAYRHGYRDGYGDGYDDRDSRGRHHRGDHDRGHRGHYDRGHHDGYDGRRGGWNSGYRDYPNAGYGGGYPNHYYAPQPGASIYYRTR